MTQPAAEPADQELVLVAQQAPPGDMRAFETLVQRHQSRVLANCRYLTRSSPDSEDLAQEVFVKAYFGLKGFEGRAQFKTWLQRIKVNHCLNFLRKNEGKTFKNIEEPGLENQAELRVDESADRRAENVGARERIAAVLDTLPDTLRVPLLMRDLDGFSYEEIAETLKIGLSAVKMRIKRGREEFRARYLAVSTPETGEFHGR